MYKKLGIATSLLIALIYSFSFLSDSERVTTEQSLEEQLLAGADPTELLEPAAAGADLCLEPIDCNDVVFGEAKGKRFIRKYGDNTYVSNFEGYKAFKMQSSSYYLNEVAIDAEINCLIQAFEKCPEPEFYYPVDITFLSK